MMQLFFLDLHVLLLLLLQLLRLFESLVLERDHHFFIVVRGAATCAMAC